MMDEDSCYSDLDLPFTLQPTVEQGQRVRRHTKRRISAALKNSRKSKKNKTPPRQPNARRSPDDPEVVLENLFNRFMQTLRRIQEQFETDMYHHLQHIYNMECWGIRDDDLRMVRYWKLFMANWELDADRTFCSLYLLKHTLMDTLRYPTRDLYLCRELGLKIDRAWNRYEQSKLCFLYNMPQKMPVVFSSGVGRMQALLPDPARNKSLFLERLLAIQPDAGHKKALCRQQQCFYSRFWGRFRFVRDNAGHNGNAGAANLPGAADKPARPRTAWESSTSKDLPSPETVSSSPPLSLSDEDRSRHFETCHSSDSLSDGTEQRQVPSYSGQRSSSDTDDLASAGGSRAGPSTSKSGRSVSKAKLLQSSSKRKTGSSMSAPAKGQQRASRTPSTSDSDLGSDFYARLLDSERERSSESTLTATETIKEIVGEVKPSLVSGPSTFTVGMRKYTVSMQSLTDSSSDAEPRKGIIVKVSSQRSRQPMEPSPGPSTALPSSVQSATSPMSSLTRRKLARILKQRQKASLEQHLPCSLSSSSDNDKGIGTSEEESLSILRSKSVPPFDRGFSSDTKHRPEREGGEQAEEGNMRDDLENPENVPTVQTGYESATEEEEAEAEAPEDEASARQRPKRTHDKRRGHLDIPDSDSDSTAPSTSKKGKRPSKKGKSKKGKKV